MIWVKQLHVLLSLLVSNKAHQILGIALKFFAGLNQLCPANRRGSCRRSWSTFRMWSRPRRYGMMRLILTRYWQSNRKKTPKNTLCFILIALSTEKAV